MISVDIQQGGVTAKGSRKKPYNVTIVVQTIPASEWEKVQEAMAEQPIMAASLLSGRMPDNIEEKFTAVDLSMLRNQKGDLETDCSCSDWSNPCKHIAAVYLLLGSESRHPAQTLEPPELPPEPRPPEVAEFCSNPLAALQVKDLVASAIVPNTDAAPPQRLGRFPIWQCSREFVPAIQAVYHAAS